MKAPNRRLKPTSERARARLQTLNKVLKQWDKARAEFPEASNNKIILFISFALGLNNNTVRAYLYEAQRITPRKQTNETGN